MRNQKNEIINFFGLCSRFIFDDIEALAILPIDNGPYGTKEMMEIFSEQKKVDYQLEIGLQQQQFLKVRLG